MPELTLLPSPRPRVLEFFAGIGLARLGLERAGFEVAWANDFEADKQAMYEGQFGAGAEFRLGDIGAVRADELPRGADLAWASSPCTDLSLAGGRAGLGGRASGVFWDVIRLLEELGSERPGVVVLENVTGLATSHGGDDLAAAIRAFNSLGYSVDALAIDARRFVPQSRARLFLVGALRPPVDCPEPNSELRPDWLQWVFGDESLRTHRASLPAPPTPLLTGFGALADDPPEGDDHWWDSARTEAFLASLSPLQRERVAAMRHEPDVKHRTAYRRTRAGAAVWEVRPDDVAGCLRTARGGSSKQAVVRLGDGRLAVRWMTPLEYARLMGAGDYRLAGVRPTQAIFGFGDAVVVPAVTWLGENYLMPLVEGRLEEASSGRRIAHDR